MSLELERHPLASSVPFLLAQHGVETDLGRAVRKADARRFLKRMLDAEAETIERERTAHEVAGRIARLNADHELNVQYLVQFGVAANERQMFQQLLSEVSEHGGLTLAEAAGLAHARIIAERQRSNGDAGASAGAAVLAGD